MFTSLMLFPYLVPLHLGSHENWVWGAGVTSSGSRAHSLTWKSSLLNIYILKLIVTPDKTEFHATV